MVYLDPLNQAFADAAAKGDPLYTKTFVEARQILETIQQHEPASDIKIEEIKVPTAAGEVTTVLFRPAATADEILPVIFYTHGGGWILGRLDMAGNSSYASVLTSILVPLFTALSWKISFDRLEQP